MTVSIYMMYACQSAFIHTCDESMYRIFVVRHSSTVRWLIHPKQCVRWVASDKITQSLREPADQVMHVALMMHLWHCSKGDGAPAHLWAQLWQTGFGWKWIVSQKNHWWLEHKIENGCTKDSFAAWPWIALLTDFSTIKFSLLDWVAQLLPWGWDMPWI